MAKQRRAQRKTPPSRKRAATPSAIRKPARRKATPAVVNDCDDILPAELAAQCEDCADVPHETFEPVGLTELAPQWQPNWTAILIVGATAMFWVGVIALVAVRH